MGDTGSMFLGLFFAYAGLTSFGKPATLTSLLIPVLNEYVGVREGISNPYGGSLADYGKCFAELEALVAKLVVQLNEEELLC